MRNPEMEAAGSFDRLLGPRDIADWLDVPLQTVYAWRHRGEGPPGLKIWRHVRYRRDAVEKWIAAQADPKRAA